MALHCALVLVDRVSLRRGQGRQQVAILRCQEVHRELNSALFGRALVPPAIRAVAAKSGNVAHGWFGIGHLVG